MNYYPQADISQNDSTEYKLLNLTYAFVSEPDQTLSILYMRDASRTHDDITFAQLNETQPSLVAIVCKLHRQHFNGSAALTNHIVAASAHLFDSFINLQKAGLSIPRYPYVTQLQYVKQAPEPDSKNFTITGIHYHVSGADIDQLLTVRTSQSPVQVVSSKVLETLWSGSTQRIPLMESLGYNDDEIVHALLTETLVNIPRASLDGVEFD